MKMSEFIAKTVAKINEGVAEIDGASQVGRTDPKSFYINDTDGSGQVGITFELPLEITPEGEVEIFDLGADTSKVSDAIPRVAFTIRKK